ncbi:MAG: hypothetical protein K2L05_07270 [Muribaculaceae bacterium]|nr:hypothetical protein [Muribaculaceae bacterium]
MRFKAASVADPMFEWTQYSEKDKSSLLSKNNSLILENKTIDGAAISFMELPVSLNDEDFIVNLLMSKSDIKEDKSFGIIFNYKNERNYAFLKFGEKQVSIIECEKGEIAVNKRVIYKINSFNDDLIHSDLEYSSDKNNIVVTIERKNGKLEFSLNGIYLCSLKNYKIEYPTFGFVAIGKNKLDIYGLEFAKEDAKETEE